MHYLTFSTLNSINQSCAEAHKLCRSSHISSTVDTTTVPPDCCDRLLSSSTKEQTDNDHQMSICGV